MVNVILGVSFLAGIILCIFSTRTRNKQKVNYVSFNLGLIALFVAFFVHTYTYSMKLDIEKREMIQISEEETVYQLITIEANDENTEFYFYYWAEIDGVEGFDNKTINSENIFVVESNQCKPMIIETLTVYEYEITEFEKWWLDPHYLNTLKTKVVQNYEIYVPEGTLEREYNLK